MDICNQSKYPKVDYGGPISRWSLEESVANGQSHKSPMWAFYAGFLRGCIHKDFVDKVL